MATLDVEPRVPSIHERIVTCKLVCGSPNFRQYRQTENTTVNILVAQGERLGKLNLPSFIY